MKKVLIISNVSLISKVFIVNKVFIISKESNISKESKISRVSIHSKGSFTVEAALLMPLILLVIFTSVSLCLYVHNRAWYTAAVYETVVSGSTQNTTKHNNEGQVMDQKIYEINQIDFPGAGDIKLTGTIGEDYTAAVWSGKAFSVFGAQVWRYSGKAECKIIKPVLFIRKVRRLALIGDSIN